MLHDPLPTQTYNRAQYEAVAPCSCGHRSIAYSAKSYGEAKTLAEQKRIEHWTAAIIKAKYDAVQ